MEYTNGTTKELPKFLVMETWDREVLDVGFFDALEDAILFANTALQDHLGCIGEYNHEFESFADIEAALGDEIMFIHVDESGKPDSFNAWCNLHDEHWDAFIVPLDGKNDYISQFGEKEGE